MMNRKKEIAKFVCGAEAFHAFVHTYFWLSGTTLHIFGWLIETPTVHMWSAIVNACVSLGLCIYAWWPYKCQSAQRTSQ